MDIKTWISKHRYQNLSIKTWISKLGYQNMDIKTWISKHGKQNNINKPKKPESIEGPPYT
jgi:hypothetical protein